MHIQRVSVIITARVKWRCPKCQQLLQTIHVNFYYLQSDDYFACLTSYCSLFGNLKFQMLFLLCMYRAYESLLNIFITIIYSGMLQGISLGFAVITRKFCSGMPFCLQSQGDGCHIPQCIFLEDNNSLGCRIPFNEWPFPFEACSAQITCATKTKFGVTSRLLLIRLLARVQKQHRFWKT